MMRLHGASFLAAFTLFASPLSQGALPAWVDTAPPGVTAPSMGAADARVLIGRRPGELGYGAEDPIRSVDGGATWTRFNVLGTRPDRFIASPTDPRVFYALAGGVATEFGGSTPSPSALYRSGDAGSTWQLLASPFALADGTVLGHLAVGAHPDLIFAMRMRVADCMLSCSYEGEKVFVSSDRGSTWKDIDAGLGDIRHGRRVFPSPSDASVVYATTSRGLFRSRDQGQSWTLVREGIDRVVIDRVDPAVLYVIRNWGSEVWVTEDGGDTWRTSSGLNVPGPNRLLLADPVQGRRVYFIGQEGQVFESRDAARTWKRVAVSSGAVLRYLDWRRDGNPAIGMNGDARQIVMAATDPDSPLKNYAVKRLEIGDDAFAVGSDLWWQPTQPGSGLSITQHSSGQMFVVWYGYEPGELVWRMMSGGHWTDGRNFTGTLYSARGPSFFAGGAFDPSRVSVFPVGTATLRFDDDNNAVFFHEVDGRRGEKALTRFNFAPPSDWAVANYADLWFDPAEPGWGVSVSHQFNKVFLSWYVYDSLGRTQWITVPDTTYRDALNAEGTRYLARYGGKAYVVRPPAQAGARGVEQDEVGTATFDIESHGVAIFSYAVAGASGSRRLQRLPF